MSVHTAEEGGGSAVPAGAGHDADRGQDDARDRQVAEHRRPLQRAVGAQARADLVEDLPERPVVLARQHGLVVERRQAGDRRHGVADDDGERRVAHPHQQPAAQQRRRVVEQQQRERQDDDRDRGGRLCQAARADRDAEDQRRDEPGLRGQPDRDQDGSRDEAGDHRVVDADRRVDQEVRAERDQSGGQESLAQPVQPSHDDAAADRRQGRSQRREYPHRGHGPQTGADQPCAQPGRQQSLLVDLGGEELAEIAVDVAREAREGGLVDIPREPPQQREASGQVCRRQQAARQNEPSPLARGFHSRRHMVST